MSTSLRAARALLVSDDSVLRGLLRDLLIREGLGVAEADGPEAALAACRRRGTALVLIDAIVGRPDMQALLERMAFELDPAPPVLLLVGSAAPAELVQHPVVSEAIVAPFSAPALVATVRQHLPESSATSHTRLRAATVDPADLASSDDD